MPDPRLIILKQYLCADIADLIMSHVYIDECAAMEREIKIRERQEADRANIFQSEAWKNRPWANDHIYNLIQEYNVIQ